jgi:hypothetical protein
MKLSRLDDFGRAMDAVLENGVALVEEAELLFAAHQLECLRKLDSEALADSDREKLTRMRARLIEIFAASGLASHASVEESAS